MRFPSLVMTVLLGGASGVAADRDVIQKETEWSDDQLVRDTDWDVIVATVMEVSAGDATNADPPTVVLEVEEVLRGKPDSERRKAILLPFRRIQRCGVGMENETREWNQQPMKKPSPAERLILMGEIRSDGLFGAYSRGLIAYSDEKHKWVVDLILAGVPGAEKRARAREEERRKKEAAAARAEAWEAEVRKGADLPGWTSAAGFIAIARAMGFEMEKRPPVAIFAASRILKGDAPKEMYVRAPAWDDVTEQVAWDRDYLIFLRVRTETSKQGEVTVYAVIGPQQGVLRADENLVKEVEKLILEKKEPGTPEPAATGTDAPKTPGCFTFHDVPLEEALQAIASGIQRKIEIDPQAREIVAGIRVNAEDLPLARILEEGVEKSGKLAFRVERRTGSGETNYARYAAEWLVKEKEFVRMVITKRR